MEKRGITQDPAILFLFFNSVLVIDFKKLPRNKTKILTSVKNREKCLVY